MGYELTGQKPTAPEGEVFRMAILTWPLLAMVALKFAPKECRPCKEWYRKKCYGGGLNAQQSVKLAAKLKAHLADESIPEEIAEHYQTEEYDWLAVGDVRDFVMFLEHCGGFIIT